MVGINIVLIAADQNFLKYYARIVSAHLKPKVLNTDTFKIMNSNMNEACTNLLQSIDLLSVLIPKLCE